MKLWMTEFPADYDVPEELETILLSRGFADTSWHNDACPSFMLTRNGHTVRMWIDHPCPYDRECGEVMSRFLLETSEYDKNHTVIFHSEDLLETVFAVLNFLDKGDSMNAKQNQAAGAFHLHMNAIVAELVQRGYSPTVEYPGYIAIGTRSYGTANGNWGWNDEDGNGGEFELQPFEHFFNVAGAIDTNEQLYARVFPAVDSDQWFEAIAEKLVARGLKAESANTGGGIICIYINAGKFKLCFGTSGTQWGADVYIGDDYQERSISMLMPSDTANPEACAVAIEIAVRKFLLIAAIDEPNGIDNIEEAFWHAVAISFPDAKSGDFPPDADRKLGEAMKAAIKYWLELNIPEVATVEDAEEVKEQWKLAKLTGKLS